MTSHHPKRPSRPQRAARPARRRLAVAVAVVVAAGCAAREDRVGGPMTEMQKNETVRRAIRSSSEGVIFMPSRKAEQVFELPRLNEIAQSLRRPAAACFLQEAVQSMEPAPGTEEGFVGVPDGQVKFRARIGPSGQVLRTEVLESGFDDPAVPQCVAKAIQHKKFPENTTGNNHYIDIIYWVSLGLAADLKSSDMVRHIRKETVMAALRAKPCIQGRASPGSYTVEGLNLVGPDGATMANRVDQSSLPEETRKCVAEAFRSIRLPADSVSFVRPVMPTVRIDVGDDGIVAVQDEDWLRVVRLEERAEKAKKQAELGVENGTKPNPPKYIDEGEPELPPEAAAAEVSGDARSEQETEPAADPAADPGRGGLKIDLGTRGSGSRSSPSSEGTAPAPTDSEPAG